MTSTHAHDPWPPLPFDGWRETQATLHRWMQIVGKVKLAATPFLNEWWNVAFTITPRGMSSGLMPYGDQAFSVDLDFIMHLLSIHVSDGRTATVPLRPRTVAAFHDEFFETIGGLGIHVPIDPMPVEIVDPVAFPADDQHRSYDADAVHRWWRVQLETAKVMQRYRSSFAGKSSPIMFFWGSFDLTTVRFCGRPASLPEGAPRFMQLAEDQENMAVGFWPGNDNHAGVPLGEPAFNAYIFPEPDGFRDAPIVPEAAFYHTELGQFILPYAAVRELPDPAEAILRFYRSAYEAAATLAGWDRPALELGDHPSPPTDGGTT